MSTKETSSNSSLNQPRPIKNQRKSSWAREVSWHEISFLDPRVLAEQALDALLFTFLSQRIKYMTVKSCYSNTNFCHDVDICQQGRRLPGDDREQPGHLLPHHLSLRLHRDPWHRRHQLCLRCSRLSLQSAASLQVNKCSFLSLHYHSDSSTPEPTGQQR